jgi:hypothetical protein
LQTPWRAGAGAARRPPRRATRRAVGRAMSRRARTPASRSGCRAVPAPAHAGVSRSTSCLASDVGLWRRRSNLEDSGTPTVMLGSAIADCARHAGQFDEGHEPIQNQPGGQRDGREVDVSQYRCCPSCARASSACKSGNDSSVAPPRESGPPQDASDERDATREETGSTVMPVTDADVASTDADAPSMDTDEASVADAASGPLTSGDGGFGCPDQMYPVVTCDRASQWCYDNHGLPPTQCLPFETTCSAYSGPPDACVGSEFYWDAAACGGGIRRCSCVTITCYAGSCTDDKEGGVIISCGVCYGAPPARFDRRARSVATGSAGSSDRVEACSGAHGVRRNSRTRSPCFGRSVTEV